MKEKYQVIALRTWRMEHQKQIDLLLDFMSDCEDLDQRGRIMDEILSIRAKIRQMRDLSNLDASKPVRLQNVTLNSLINGNSNDAQLQHASRDQQTLDAA